MTWKQRCNMLSYALNNHISELIIFCEKNNVISRWYSNEEQNDKPKLLQVFGNNICHISSIFMASVIQLFNFLYVCYNFNYRNGKLVFKQDCNRLYFHFVICILYESMAGRVAELELDSHQTTTRNQTTTHLSFIQRSIP